MSGGNAAELKANAAKLSAASAPVLSAIAKAQPMINPETLTSHSADAWSAEWQAIARSVATYLAYTLPGNVQASRARTASPAPRRRRPRRLRSRRSRAP